MDAPNDRMKSPAQRLVRYMTVLFLLLTSVSRAIAEPAVYVILWFDTEDYLLPADDDATLRICDFLTAEGIRCTHKLVGEKVRVLEQRGRHDVIAALRRHEVGYHTDFHSVQPTPALFLSQQGWDDGVAEFDRRERRGLLDVERITGQKPSCYGQPGSSWGPQQFGAMRLWGVPVYLDAGSHVQLNGDPFWYCGILNLYGLKATLRTSLGGSTDLAEAKKRFDQAYEELLSEGGGPVSIFYHPCEFVHKQFWDGVNFSRGANPPRSEWKIPPQKTAEETRVAFETFEGYIRFIKQHPKVRFVTAREALDLYADRAQGRSFSPTEIAMIAKRVSGTHDRQSGDGGVSFLRENEYALSAGEVLLLLNTYAAAPQAGRRRQEGVVLAQTPIGPTQLAPRHDAVEATRNQLERTVADVANHLDRHGRVPNAVWLGSAPVSPESYLSTLARYVESMVSGDLGAESYRFEPQQLRAGSYVSEDQPKLWGWVIFPPGFKAPEMMQLAKRQAWTLKPAILRSESSKH